MSVNGVNLAAEVTEGLKPSKKAVKHLDRLSTEVGSLLDGANDEQKSKVLDPLAAGLRDLFEMKYNSGNFQSAKKPDADQVRQEVSQSLAEIEGVEEGSLETFSKHFDTLIQSLTKNAKGVDDNGSVNTVDEATEASEQQADNTELKSFFDKLLENCDGDFDKLFGELSKVLSGSFENKLLEQSANFEGKLDELMDKVSKDGSLDYAALKQEIKGMSDVEKAHLYMHYASGTIALNFAQDVEIREPKTLSAKMEQFASQLPEREGPRDLQVHREAASALADIIGEASELSRSAEANGQKFDYAKFYEDRLSVLIGSAEGQITKEDLLELKSTIDFSVDLNEAKTPEEKAGLLSGVMGKFGAPALMFVFSIVAEPLSNAFGMFGSLGKPFQVLLSQAHQHASTLIMGSFMGAMGGGSSEKPAADSPQAASNPAQAKRRAPSRNRAYSNAV